MSIKPIQIATARYWSPAIRASRLVPLGSSVGMPRYLGYEIGGNVGLLAPHGLRKIEDDAEFDAAYLARLERFGVKKIADVLTAFARGYDAKGVVLLCFEDITKDGVSCHRTLFGEWWTAQTGDRVVEL